jgi:hypothetical protein
MKKVVSEKESLRKKDKELEREIKKQRESEKE